MKQKLFCTLGLVLLALVGFAANPAGATAAAGPYYANPSWDQTLSASTRFIVLSNMSSAAVLDRETGLVWEQSPSTSVFVWDDAQANCNDFSRGGRLGWRLPTLQELASLVDPSVPPPGPRLPSGHPFSNVVPTDYWSATTHAADASEAYVVNFSLGAIGSPAKNLPFLVWCVRGGQGVDAQ
jgi:hypothetical protein